MAVYTVPAEVDDTGTADVTAALNAWLATVPNGTSSERNALQFGTAKTYRVEGTFNVAGRSWLNIDGGGSTFVTDTAGTRTRAHCQVQNSSHIQVTGYRVRGPNVNGGLAPEAYVASLEAQHAFHLQGSIDVRIADCAADLIYGDWVYVGGYLGARSDGVLIEDCTFDRNGRQGFGFVGCLNVEVRNNTTGDCRRSLMDFEPNGMTSGSDTVWVHHNTFGRQRLTWVASKGYPGPVDNITVEDNTSEDVLSVICTPTQPGLRNNWAIRRNTSTGSSGSPSAHTQSYTWVDGLEVTGNTQPMQAGRNMTLAYLYDCTDYVVSGNTIPNGIGQSQAFVTPPPLSARRMFRLPGGGVVKLPDLTP